MTQRVLLLGANGMLAHDLIALTPPQVELEPLDARALDVTDEAALAAAVARARPDVILNAAAYTRVDDAERERERAMAVNGGAVGSIGRVAAGSGALVVHFSSDYLFNGTTGIPLAEDAPTQPLGVYALSKLAGEEALKASGARHIILRTQWLFGRHGRSFPRTMWERAVRRQATKVVNDQFGRPTYTVDLARATWRLLTGSDTAAVHNDRQTARPPATARESFRDRPVFHVANAGIATWYDVARAVFRLADVERLVAPCTTAEYPTPALRPAWSVLDTTKFDQRFGASLPPWTDAVERFIAEIRTATPA